MPAQSYAIRRSARSPLAEALARWRRRALVFLVLAVVLCAGYLLWFRDLPMFKVRDVAVSGLTTSQAAQVRHDLERAARDMTALHVDIERLEEAAARYPVVAGLDVQSQLPDGLRISVTERPPAAVLEASDGGRLPVAGDGTVLEGVRADGVPSVPVQSLPRGDRVDDEQTRVAAAVAAAAPSPLSGEVARVVAPEGKPIEAQMSNGMAVIFGDAARLDEKWAAAAAALADPRVEGSVYLDVTLPERPVAGTAPVDVPAEPEPAAPEPAAPEPAAPAPEDGAAPDPQAPVP
jgi:cell division protein FtsQ